MKDFYFVGDENSVFLKYVFYSKEKLKIGRILIFKDLNFEEITKSDNFIAQRYNLIMATQSNNKINSIVWNSDDKSQHDTIH